MASILSFSGAGWGILSAAIAGTVIMYCAVSNKNNIILITFLFNVMNKSTSCASCHCCRLLSADKASFSD